VSVVGANPAGTASLWRPLRVPIFRNLLIADIASDMGTFIQGVAAAWMMVSLNAGPLYIALTQTASALPFFILAMPAGVIGDIVNRRKLILFSEIWMLCIAVVLTVTTMAGGLPPSLLLILTFALSAGDAFESPSWRAVLPELVSKEDLPAATALNGIEYNLARALGPALAGIVITLAGISTAFFLNAASFLGVLFVIGRWKRHPRARTAPPETLSGATAAAMRYVRYSPALRALLIRSGAVMFFASALLALLPSVAHRVSKSPLGYGILLGCFGAGAILGALMMERVRARWPVEIVVSTGILIFGLSTLASGTLRLLSTLGASMLIGGASWIVFVSFFNVIILNNTPDWVRARVLAISMLVFQGAMAAGSAVWGALAARTDLHVALLWAGAGTIGTTALGAFLKLPDAPADVTPWVHWRLPNIQNEDASAVNSGPVLVTVEYDVDPQAEAGFLQSMHRYERIRRRDGAYRWGVFRDIENANRYLESFLVVSWAEHLRQHQRSTRADRAVEEAVHNYVHGEPVVRHLLYVATKS
jgi:predicted MFS family arabinose efflux permease